MKCAVFTMDIEDWYHLDYFIDENLDRSYTMLDGIDRYVSLLSEYEVKSTFFVLSSLVDKLKNKLIYMSSIGHELACHGDDHTRPLKIDIKNFRSRTTSAKRTIEDRLGVPVSGYRASSFSLDRERLDIVGEIGFLYDSSKNSFEEHPLYGRIDMNGYEQINKNVYRCQEFFEFETSAVSLMKKNMPVSGGAYVRVFPWVITEKLVRKYIEKNDFYVFYIHPFELSASPPPPLDPSISLSTKARFLLGRSTVENKIRSLIELLISEGFEFLTFSEYRNFFIKDG